MIISKKNFITSLLGVVLFLVLFFGCAEYQNQINDSSDSKADNVSIISYCAKEKSEENRIFFSYPQFKETVPNAEKMNGLILEFVDMTLQIMDGGFNGKLKDSPENWNWNEDDYTLQAMEISYIITRNDSDYISIAFDGEFYHKMLPHPIQCFYSITLDKINEKTVFIDDLYRIDDDFVKLFQRKINELAREGLAKRFQALPEDIPDDIVQYVLESFSDAKLHEIKECFTSDNGYSYPFFLTDDSVGISIPQIFAIGGHFEILITYEELMPFAL